MNCVTTLKQSANYEEWKKKREAMFRRLIVELGLRRTRKVLRSMRRKP